MLKKILATASVAGILAGAAGALEITPAPEAAGYGNFPLLLAEELPYGSVAGITTTAAGSGLLFNFAPTGGTFPTGNVLMRVEVTNATFTAALTGAEVDSPGTGVISTGGTSGGNVVTFLLSDISTCGQMVGAPAVLTVCSVELPLRLSGEGNVSVAVGLETDAGAPIDNTSLTQLKSANLAILAPAFTIDIEADAVPTFAELDPTAPFTELATLPDGDNNLGTISVQPTERNVGTTLAPTLRTVRKSLAGVEVDETDVASVVVTVAGNMTPFVASLLPGATAAGVSIDGVGATVSATAGTAIRNVAGGVPAVFIDGDVLVDENSVTTIARSPYQATVVVNAVPGGTLTAGASATGALQSIGRAGAEVTFPWTQSATQGQASGTTSVFRIGNLSGLDTGAVFAEVLNSSESGFTNPGITQVATSIDAGGEFVINSAQLEAVLGDYGRGDVSFVIEADDTELTGRQYVVRNGNIQNVIGGTIAQDQ